MATALLCMAILLIGIALASALLLPDPQTIEGRRSLPRNSRSKVLYVALGDSAVFGAGASEAQHNYVGRLFARLRTIYPNAQMVNLCASGTTAASVTARQLRYTVALRPDLITLSIGRNDILQGRDVRDYERDVETIFRTLADETKAVVVVNLLPDLSRAVGLAPAESSAAREQTARFNAIL